MAFRWSQPPRNTSSTPFYASTPDSFTMLGNTSTFGKQSAESSSWTDPLPLEESAARYVLKIMVMLLGNIHADTPWSIPGKKYADPAFRDEDSGDTDLAELASRVVSVRGKKGKNHLRNRASSNSVQSSTPSFAVSIPRPAGTPTYEKTSMTMIRSLSAVNGMIAKYAGRVIFHISASNWNVVLDRLQRKIRQLASHNVDGTPDLADLHVLSYSCLDRSKLILIMNGSCPRIDLLVTIELTCKGTELSSLLVNMEYQTLMSISNPIRIAVWHWIDLHPEEFNDSIRHRGRLEGAPERIFDLFHSKIQQGSERYIWPTLAVLACISSDRLTNSPGRSHKTVKFGAEVSRALPQQGRLAGLALESALEICRAATHVYSNASEDVPLRMLAFDLAHDIKVKNTVSYFTDIC